MLHLYEGTTATANGDWETAEMSLEEVVRIGEALGDRRLMCDGLNQLQLMFHHRGHFTRSLEVGLRFAQVVAQTNNALHAVWVDDVRGLNLLHLGQTEAAIALLEQSWKTIARLLSGGPTHCVITSGLIAAYLAQGRLAEAQTIAQDTAQRIARPLQIVYLEAFGLSAVAEAAVATWAQARSNSMYRRDAQRACVAMLLSAWIFPIGRPRAFRCLSRYLMLAGHTRLAAWMLRRSLAEAQRRRMPYEAACSHEALAGITTGAVRRAHVAYAAALYARSDAVGNLRRLLGR
jgi:hypothetical protein